ncbi:MAG: recombinase RecF, partial [Candidatus Eisenbacteria bacterium]
LIITTHSPTLIELIQDKMLYTVKKKDARTSIAPFESQGELYRDSQIEDDLMESRETTSLSRRVISGEFDA